MKDLLKAVDKLPWIAKLILCLPALDIVWAVYRIIKGVVAKDNVKVIIGAVWILGACTITWIFDLVTVILNKNNPSLTR